MDTYIVKEGETIESVASMFNIPAVEIIKANSLVYPYTLTKGNILNIPTGQVNVFNYYTVKKGDTLYGIANANNTTVGILSSINGLDPNEYIYEGQTLLVPKNGISTYITKSGDTINSVASVFNTYPQDILYSNSNIYLLPDQLIVYRKI